MIARATMGIMVAEAVGTTLLSASSMIMAMKSNRHILTKVLKAAADTTQEALLLR